MKSKIIGHAMAIFGGNIAVTAVKYPELNDMMGIVLCELEDGKYQIGDNINTEDLSEPKIELIFNDVKSVETVIEALTTIKDLFNKN